MTEPAKSQALAQLDPQSLISQAITSGTSVEAIEKLVDLALRMREVQAREAFNAAMAQFHQHCPPIYKTAVGQVGNAKTQYAPLDGIMATIRPELTKQGLTVSWRSPRSESGKVIKVCRISHTLGHHEESGEVVIPVGTAGAATPAQQVGVAIAYAERYSLKDVLGLAPEKEEDTDGAAEPAGKTGKPDAAQQTDADVLISESQQRRLWATLRKSGWGDSDQGVETAMHDILAGFQIEHIKHVPEARLEEIVSVIKAGPRK